MVDTVGYEASNLLFIHNNHHNKEKGGITRHQHHHQHQTSVVVLSPPPPYDTEVDELDSSELKAAGAAKATNDIANAGGPLMEEQQQLQYHLPFTAANEGLSLRHGGHSHSLSLGQISFEAGHPTHHAAAGGYNDNHLHQRSFSATNLASPYFQQQQQQQQQHLDSSAASSSSAGGSSVPCSRTQTISPLIGHAQLTPQDYQHQHQHQHQHYNLQPSLHHQFQHSAGLGLANLSSQPTTNNLGTPTVSSHETASVVNNLSSSNNGSTANADNTITSQSGALPLAANGNGNALPPSSMYSHALPSSSANTYQSPFQIHQPLHQQQAHAHQQYVTQHPYYEQRQQHAQGHETPPSPSTAHSASLRHHSMTDSLSYAPSSYTSPDSSINSSSHLLAGQSAGNKHSYDTIGNLNGNGDLSSIYGNSSSAPQNNYTSSSSSSRPSTQPMPGSEGSLASFPSSSTLSSSSAHHHHYQHQPPHQSSPSQSHLNLHNLSQPHHHQQYLPPSSYPLAHSAQGFMTVYSTSPMYGAKDSQVYLEVGIAPHDPHYIRGFRVLFGNHGTTTRVIAESRTDGEEKVELMAVTPAIQLTNRIPAHGMTCPLSLQALDESGKVADWADLGVFEYTDVLSPSRRHKRPGSPLTSLRDSPGDVMRSVLPDQSPYMDQINTFGSGGGGIDGGSNVNRTLSGSTGSSGGPPSHKRGHSRGSSMGSLVNGFGFMSAQGHSRNSSLASNLNDLDFQPQHQISQNSIGTGMPGIPPTSANGLPNGGTTSMWYTTPEGELIERKPIARLRAPTSLPTSTPSSSTLRHPPMETATEATPTLYRTSQLPSTGSDGTSSVATKAALKFETDLNNMALGWSHDEWHAKRRLVLFERKQDGGTINASFRPVSLHEITPNSIVISCIFRDDKNECFVTSVDMIYLLEALVSVRFTVEEKNRIRRNLEGYKPITITKAKNDCEDFFKVIMGFPNPKPRNIEKDVKVFPWKILANALKKIISKYSASFVKPKDMVGPGKPPPQPIGWPPGRTPSPPGTGAGIAASSKDTASSISGMVMTSPPSTAIKSEAKNTSSSSFSTSPLSASLHQGNHMSLVGVGLLGSVAEDEMMIINSTLGGGGSNGNSSSSHLLSNSNGTGMQRKSNSSSSSATNGNRMVGLTYGNQLQHHQQQQQRHEQDARPFPPPLQHATSYQTADTIDELATPQALYDVTIVETEPNPFQFA